MSETKSTSTEINGKEYMEDPHGRLVPVDKIDAIVLIKDGLVKRMVAKAQDMQELLREYKDISVSELESHITLAAEEYGVAYGGKKGNITMLSYDGRYKIQRQMGEAISFDEGVMLAKGLIDECLTRWTEGGNANIREIVAKAFQVDKQGRFNAQKLMDLVQMDIDDDTETWGKAMDIIKKCRRVVGVTEYIRAYKLRENGNGKGKGEWDCISLDITKL